MPLLVQQRCLHHPDREAIARCPQCHRSFCRECVTEHDDLLICASCLQRITSPPAKKERTWTKAILPAVGALCGLLLAWISFYSLGRMLISIPSTFHQSFSGE
jgi:hypothetical protein